MRIEVQRISQDIEPVPGQHFDDPERIQDRDGTNEQTKGGENPQRAANIKQPQRNAAGFGALIQKQGGDQESRNDEKDADTEIGMQKQESEGERMRSLYGMARQNKQDGDGAEAIERREPARLSDMIPPRKKPRSITCSVFQF